MMPVAAGRRPVAVGIAPDISPKAVPGIAT